MARLPASNRLRIENPGEIIREQVLNLYKHSRALNFSSTSESFGLPLPEAATCSLSVMASGLGYAHDLAIPAAHIDAGSAVYTESAVGRFPGCSVLPVAVMTASGFLERIPRP